MRSLTIRRNTRSTAIARYRAAHSQDEERFTAIGETSEGRSVFVAFTLRHHDGETFIRPISAR